MVQSISYLHIKPFAKHTDTAQRETTITSFEDMLHSEKTSDEIAAESKGKQTLQENEDAVSDQTTALALQDGTGKALFQDPITGKTVIYKDVAKISKENIASKTSSASSMKKTKYDAYFKKAAKRYGVSESLLKAIAKAESNFNAKDVSSAGAIGVMQLMPATAKSLGVENPYDPEENIMGGAKCIKQKLKEFNGNVKLALAAYNAGSGAVKRNGGVPSYCKSYISRVLSYKEAFETASAVG